MMWIYADNNDDLLHYTQCYLVLHVNLILDFIILWCRVNVSSLVDNTTSPLKVTTLRDFY